MSNPLVPRSSFPLVLRSFFPRIGLLLLPLALAFGGCKAPESPSGSGQNSVSTNETSPGGASDEMAKTAKAYPADAKTLLVGIHTSLTGDTATFGISTQNGINLAFDQINARGGVLGKKLETVSEDNSSRSEQAPGAVLKLINDKNVLVVMGDVASSNSIAAAPYCQSAGVPMVSPSSTNVEVTKKGDYIFRTCFIDPFQGDVMSKFARETLKVKTAAIFTDKKSAYSQGLSEAFKASFEKSGGQIVSEESYAKGDTDFRSQLTNIKGKNPDVIFLPGYYTEVGNICVQAKSLGIKAPFLGGDGWDSPELVKIGGDAVNGAYFSNHYALDSPSPQGKKFVQDYTARFQKSPDAIAVVAYDAAGIVADAIKRAGSTDRKAIRDALASTKNFPGVTGNITINAERNADKPLVVVQIRGGKQVFVKSVQP